jgi:hypothetical protein
VYLGGSWLAVVVGLATLLAGWEFYALLRTGGYGPSTALGLLFIVLLLQSARWCLPGVADGSLPAAPCCTPGSALDGGSPALHLDL